LPRLDWSCALPRPLVIPKVMTLKTLADVRELMRHIPADRRERWGGGAGAAAHPHPPPAGRRGGRGAGAPRATPNSAKPPRAPIRPTSRSRCAWC
jgi:hypothetical protein